MRENQLPDWKSKRHENPWDVEEPPAEAEEYPQLSALTADVIAGEANATQRMKDLSPEERPQERLVELGAENLTKAELLAILLRTGLQGKNVLTLAQEILDDVDQDLLRLLDGGVEGLCAHKGVGRSKAVTVLAAIEFGRRCIDRRSKKRTIIRTPNDIYELLFEVFYRLDHEQLWVVYLNQGNQILDQRMHSKGGRAHSTFDVSIIAREALLLRASAVALAHNHPGGAREASRQDIVSTQRLKEALETFGITLLDHLIFADGEPPYLSMRNLNLL